MTPDDILSAPRAYRCDLCGDEHPSHIVNDSSDEGGDALCAVCLENLERNEEDAAFAWWLIRQSIDQKSHDARLGRVAWQPKW
jgi:hypothetical protein